MAMVWLQSMVPYKLVPVLAVLLLVAINEQCLLARKNLIGYLASRNFESMRRMERHGNITKVVQVL